MFRVTYHTSHATIDLLRQTFDAMTEIVLSIGRQETVIWYRWTMGAITK